MSNIRKKQHIMESNQRLERRYLVEQPEEGKITPEKQEEIDEKILKIIDNIQKTHPETSKSCEKMYESLKHGDIRDLERQAEKCLASLSFSEKANIKSEMLKYAKKQSEEISPENKKDSEQKVYFAVGIISGLLGLWEQIRRAFEKEQR